MDRGVGTTLREARDRRQVALAEVEASTRIRLRYLNAIENEEWDVLPGGVYTRGFIRTYASFLGLDGERLVADYRESVERWHRTGEEQAPAAPVAEKGESGWLRGVPTTALAVLAVVAVAAVAIVAVPGGGGGGDGPATVSPEKAGETGPEQEVGPQPVPSRGIAVSLETMGEVWVCVLDARGTPVVDGQILEAGEEEGPFSSGSFTVSFGNGEVKMLIDGREAEIPATSSPVGYAIDSAGHLTELGETERPTCT